TCDTRNPAPSWTDVCPLPVLAQTLVFGSSALSVLFMGYYNWAFPFFGVILDGAVGAVLVLLVGAVSAGLAWARYKLKPAAWWASMVFVILWGLSTLITFSRVSIIDFYEKMDFPEQQLEMMRKLYEDQNIDTIMLYSMLFWLIAMLGFSVFNRRYFLKPDDIHRLPIADESPE
ncbi:MAG: hypothetical protein L3K26_16530, partial [Candidatus Hydrogenedentes bacterium]|nr:hypothetical protein [Candidatus Hydrogenedentota bacterium]